MITDKDIKMLFVNNEGKILPHMLKDTWMDNHQEVKEYLLGRYDDTTSPAESVYRIVYGIHVRPVCPVCGKPVKFEPNKFTIRGTYFANYCSRECSYKSPERNANVTKGKLRGYADRKSHYDETFSKQIKNGLCVGITEEEALDEYAFIKETSPSLDFLPDNNKCVLRFQEDNFYHREKFLFSNDKNIRSLMIDRAKKFFDKKPSELSDAEILDIFKTSEKIQPYSHFSPFWTKYFAQQNNIKCVVDPFGGWGHHLIGFASAGCKVYYNDKTENTVDGVRKLVNFLKCDAKLSCMDAIDYDIPSDCDAAFLSYPYFNDEIYECGEFESIEVFNNTVSTVIKKILDSNVTTIGVITRDDYAYLLKPLMPFLLSKEIINNYDSRYLRKRRWDECLYTFKIDGEKFHKYDRDKEISSVPSWIDDDYIKEQLLCYNSNNGVWQLKTGAERKLKTLPEYADMKAYLDNRFPDANAFGNVTYKEIIWRITHNIEVRPVCPVCGKPVPFRTNNTSAEIIPGYANTCSTKCRYVLSAQNMTETMIERYDCSTNLMLPGIHELAEAGHTAESYKKREETWKEKYGTPNILNRPDIRDKAIKSSAEFRTNQSIKYNELKVYLLEHPDVLLEILKEKYTVSHNKKYKGRYDHRCDFYIEELDLFIEYQGTSGHQNEPYIKEDNGCAQKLENLNMRARFLSERENREDCDNYFLTVIKNWTISDVNKRNEAKRNHLNYLEIFPNFPFDEVIPFIEKYYSKGTTDRQIIVGAVRNNTNLEEL